MVRAADAGQDAGVVTNFDSDSPLTIVAFGGLTEDRDAPAFEFCQFLSGFDVRRVFLRDHEQAWYQLGVRGAGGSIEAVEAYLLDLLGVDGCRRALFTGGSMGGYAAMFFGARLHAGEVHAFAPQTYLDRLRRRYYKDFRWQRAVNRMWESRDGRKRHLDLGPVLRQASRSGAVPIHIHVAEHEPDMVHAVRLRRIPGVTIHLYAEATDHRIARTLNEDGRLRTIFEEGLNRLHLREPIPQSRNGHAYGRRAAS